MSNHHNKDITENIPTIKNLNFEKVLSHNAVPNRSIKNRNNEVLGPPK